MKPSNNSVDAQHLPSGSGSSEKSTASPSSSSNGSPTDGRTDKDSSSFRDTQSLNGNDFTNNSSDSTQSKCSSSTSDIAGGECSSSSVTQGNKRKRKTSSRKSLLAKMLSFEDELSTDESCADEGEASTESITLKSPDVTESSPLSKTGSEEFLASNADVEEGSYEELWEKCLISALSLFEDYGDIVSIGDSSETLDQSNVIISLGNSNRKTETGRELAKVTMQREDAFSSTLKMEGGREFAKDSIQIEDAFNLNLKAEEERGIGNESVQKEKEFL